MARPRITSRFYFSMKRAIVIRTLLKAKDYIEVITETLGSGVGMEEEDEKDLAELARGHA